VITSDGSVWASIIAHAEEQDAAVIVVGSRGRSGIKSALLGSVSTGVAHHCSRPVLVVH
jgi:nucleotide-binding universal stress UspA family protein